MTKAQTYPTANGKRFTLDLDIHADVPPYMDHQHSDRLDNFTVRRSTSRNWLVASTAAWALQRSVKSNPCPTPGISRYPTAERDTDRKR
jgi:hypothetical protein